MNNTLEEIMEQTDSTEAGRALQRWMRETARKAFLNLVEEEVSALCGPKHNPKEKNSFRRAGSSQSSIYIEGKKESAKRPRVRKKRDAGSDEVGLKTWKAAQDPKEWEEAMKRAILCGVSCRDMETLTVEKVRGMSKSCVSRLWQRKAAGIVEEMQQKDLSKIDVVALMLDGVVLCRGLVATVALGIDTKGIKHILGFRVGSSENQEVCRDLLSNLQRRGMKARKDRQLLAVLDGSAALRKALLELFPNTILQRCLVHKERNIRGYLPRKDWKELAELFKRLRRSQGEDQAKEAKIMIQAFLADKNAQARDSLEEAGEELIAFFELEVPNTLNITFLSTNIIENTFRNLRRHIGRVARWRKETRQADLWLASGLTLAEAGFRRVRGFDEFPSLLKALEKKKLEERKAA
jgi:putative transposase